MEIRSENKHVRAHGFKAFGAKCKLEVVMAWTAAEQTLQRRKEVGAPTHSEI
jgi:hypothetical protein